MEGVVYSDKQLVISRDASGGLAIAGAVDYFNAGAVAECLDAEMQRPVPIDESPGLNGVEHGDADLQVDLSRLEFSDVTGIRALVRVAEEARGGRRLVLRGLAPQISRVMAVVGWSELPNLVVEAP